MSMAKPIILGSHSAAVKAIRFRRIITPSAKVERRRWLTWWGCEASQRRRLRAVKAASAALTTVWPRHSAIAPEFRTSRHLSGRHSFQRHDRHWFLSCLEGPEPCVAQPNHRHNMHLGTLAGLKRGDFQA